MTHVHCCDPEPEPLDVDRLADALRVALNKPSPAGRYDLLAQLVAAEYDASPSEKVGS